MKTPIFIVVFLLVCSCYSKKSKESGNSDSVIRIDLLYGTETIVTKLSEFAENIEYLRA